MAESRLLVAFVTGISLASPAGAVMYKWVDNNGTTHYSETVPPEYADKNRVELDKSGRVIKKETVITTPEQRRAQQEEQDAKRAEEQAELERKRRDHALLNTYSNVKEIDLARDRNLQQVQAHIDSIDSQIETVSDKLQSLNKEINANIAAGKRPQPSLRDDIKEAQDRLTRLQQELKKTREDKFAIEKRFDADKARYRELTGKQ